MGNFGVVVTLFLVFLSILIVGAIAIRHSEAVMSTLAVVCLLAVVASLVFTVVNLRESGPLVILVQITGMAAASYMLWNHWNQLIGGGPSRVSRRRT